MIEDAVEREITLWVRPAKRSLPSSGDSVGGEQNELAKRIKGANGEAWVGHLVFR